MLGPSFEVVANLLSRIGFGNVRPNGGYCGATLDRFSVRDSDVIPEFCIRRTRVYLSEPTSIHSPAS